MRVKLAANLSYVFYAPQIRLNNEIPNNGFLPCAFGLDAEMRFPESLMFQL